jgi:hypothetical protein
VLCGPTVPSDGGESAQHHIAPLLEFTLEKASTPVVSGSPSCGGPRELEPARAVKICNLAPNAFPPCKARRVGSLDGNGRRSRAAHPCRVESPLQQQLWLDVRVGSVASWREPKF